MEVRVVLDTNVLISAVLKPGGLEATVVNAVLAGAVHASVTPEIRAEYDEVFARKKFAVVRESSRRLLDALARCAQNITPLSIVTAALDPDDNCFLECSEAARANFLVTGNLRHYPAQWGVTLVVNARQFSKLITSYA